MRDSNALWKPSPNFWTGRSIYRPQYIIIHATAGGGSVEWLCNPISHVSAHYCVLRDGTIYQLVDEEDTAWANGGLSAGHAFYWNESINPNYLTISIEHEKLDKDNTSILTPAQAQSSFQLVERICYRWGIPPQLADNEGGITGHYSLDPVERSNCPGAYPWDQLLEYLGGETMLQIGQGIGSYFEDRGGVPPRWHCTKTHVDLIGDNLAFYRKHDGIFGLPLRNELYLPQYPFTAIVVCERALLVYDPQRKIDNPPGDGPCYLLHIESGIGQELLSERISELQATLDTYHKTLQNVLATIKSVI